MSADRRPPHIVDATMFWNPTGGVQRYIGAKRDWLTRHTGWRHTVATPTPANDDSDVVLVPSLPLPFSAGAYRLPWRRRASARLLRAAAPDLIESADPYRLAWATLDAARALGIPAVAFCHSNLEQMAGLVGGSAGRAAGRRYAVRLYRRFDLVLAPSLAMTGHLHDWGIAGAVHQPLGVDVAAFRPLPRTTDLRNRLGLGPEARIVAFAGRFAPEKNLQTLADAVGRLGDRYRFLAIGDGPTPPRGGHVVIMPTVREPAALAALFAEADVFAHAGAQETFGLSVLEAMACGLPVVVRAAEGLVELVDASVGRAVSQGSAERFATAIDDIFASDCTSLGQAARRRAEGYAWDRVLPALAARYRRLLGLSADPSAAVSAAPSSAERQTVGTP